MKRGWAPHGRGPRAQHCWPARCDDASTRGPARSRRRAHRLPTTTTSRRDGARTRHRPAPRIIAASYELAEDKQKKYKTINTSNGHMKVHPLAMDSEGGCCSTVDAGPEDRIGDPSASIASLVRWAPSTGRARQIPSIRMCCGGQAHDGRFVVMRSYCCLLLLRAAQSLRWRA